MTTPHIQISKISTHSSTFPFFSASLCQRQSHMSAFPSGRPPSLILFKVPKNGVVTKFLPPILFVFFFLKDILELNTPFISSAVQSRLPFNGQALSLMADVASS